MSRKKESHKFLRNLKSQAALEFLTTYAWAFLVILIMVGALAYFGILNPSKLLPDRCNFGSEITCDKNRMVVRRQNDNTLEMTLTNSFGTAVIVQDTTTVTTDVILAGSCTAQMAALGDTPVIIPGGGFTWSSDTAVVFVADCSTGTGLIENEKIKFNIEIAYYAASAGPTYAKKIFGEVFTTIQAP